MGNNPSTISAEGDGTSCSSSSRPSDVRRKRKAGHFCGGNDDFDDGTSVTLTSKNKIPKKKMMKKRQPKTTKLMLLGLRRVTFPPGWDDHYRHDAAVNDLKFPVPLTDGLILGRTPKNNVLTPTKDVVDNIFDGSNNNNNNNDDDDDDDSPASVNKNIGACRKVLSPSPSPSSSSSTPSQKQQPQYANLGLAPKIDKKCHRISRKHLVVVGTTTSTSSNRNNGSDAVADAAAAAAGTTMTVKLRFLQITNSNIKVSVNGVDKTDSKEFELQAGDRFMIASKNHTFEVVPCSVDVPAAPWKWRSWNDSWVPEVVDDDCSKGNDNFATIEDIRTAAAAATTTAAAATTAATTSASITNRTAFMKNTQPSFFNLPLAVEQTYRASLLESGSSSDDPVTAYEFLQSQLNVQHRLPPQGSKLCHQLMKVLTFGTAHSGNVSIGSTSSSRRMSELIPGSTSNTKKVTMSDFVSDDATIHQDDNEGGMNDNDNNHLSLSRFYWDPTRQQLALQYYCSLLDVAPYIMIPRLIEMAPGQAQWWMTVLDGVDQALSSFSLRNMTTTLQQQRSIDGSSDKENTDSQNDNAADPAVVHINVRARAQIQFFQLQACAVSALTKLLVVSWNLYMLNEMQKSEGKQGLSDEKVEDDDESVSSDSSSDDDEQNGFFSSDRHEVDHERLFELLQNIQQFGTNGKGVIQRIAQIIAKLFVTQRHFLSVTSLSYESSTNVDDKKSVKSNQKRSSNPSAGGKYTNASTGKYIGCRSAHCWNLTDKSKEVYNGTVTRKIGKKYEVKFDDGDKCEYQEKDIIAGIELYKKEEGTVDTPKEGNKPDDLEIEQTDSLSTASFLVNHWTPSVLENLTDAVATLTARLAALQSIVWTITEPTRYEKNGQKKKRKRGGATETNKLRKERTKMLWDAMHWSLKEECDGNDTNSLVQLWIRTVGGQDGMRNEQVSNYLEELAGFA